MKMNACLLSVILSSTLALFFVSSNAHAKTSAARYADTCRVVADSGGILIEASAQYKEVSPGDDISQGCLAFAKSVAVTVCDYIKDNGNVQIYYNRWFKPGSDEAIDHCHYICMGFADSACEDKCKAKPTQIGTNIGTLPCSQGSSDSKKSK
jgi:hypothetical protein